MAAIISLVTDFGLKDFYAGALKGAILKLLPDAVIVDTCHQVSPFDTAEAAFVLKNAYSYFPANTLHVVCVNEKMDANTRHLVLRHNDHLFIGPDNGLFSMALDGEPELVYELERYRDSQPGFAGIFPMLAQAIKFIATGGNIKDLGKPVYEIRKAVTLQPLVQDNQLRGSVVYIDSFENVVVNISVELFRQASRGRAFSIMFKRSERIREINRFYYEVAEGERLCIFNAQGYLEIAVNKGKAASLLGLQVGDTIQIEFA